jgi:hypothetical protein
MYHSNDVLLSFTFGSKNDNILQLGSILNNEVSVVESFFSDFWHGSRYFSKKFANPKIIT